MSNQERSYGLTPLFWVAVLLPLVGYVGSIGLAEAKRWGAPTIEVAIEGYDPRDLFRGHYLNYRLAVENRTEQQDHFYQSCVGAPKDGLSPVFVYEGASRPSHCVRDLPDHFVFEPHRFYIQQDKARALENAVMNGRATITLRLVGKRHVLVDQLLVDRKVTGSK